MVAAWACLLSKWAVDFLWKNVGFLVLGSQDVFGIKLERLNGLSLL